MELLLVVQLGGEVFVVEGVETFWALFGPAPKEERDTRGEVFEGEAEVVFTVTWGDADLRAVSRPAISAEDWPE